MCSKDEVLIIVVQSSGPVLELIKIVYICTPSSATSAVVASFTESERPFVTVSTEKDSNLPVM